MITIRGAITFSIGFILGASLMKQACDKEAKQIYVAETNGMVVD